MNDQIRSRASERRVREIDATGAFTPEFERNADTERLVRRIPARLERCLRIRALFRDVDASEICSASQPRCNQRPVMFISRGERRLKSKRIGR